MEFLRNFGSNGSTDFYRLSLGAMTSRGNLSESMMYHSGQAFSTPDKDNDSSVSNNCAKQSKVSG